MKRKLIWAGWVIFFIFGMGAANSASCDKKSAQKVQGLIEEMAKISRERGFIRIQWGNGFHTWGSDKQLQMAQIAANADACLTGFASEIRFYSPAGKFNAIASPTSGIRLVD